MHRWHANSVQLEHAHGYSLLILPVLSQAALRTRIFKHHLDLGHNSQAYEALTQNPDPSRYCQPGAVNETRLSLHYHVQEIFSWLKARFRNLCVLTACTSRVDYNL